MMALSNPPATATIIDVSGDRHGLDHHDIHSVCSNLQQIPMTVHSLVKIIMLMP